MSDKCPVCAAKLTFTPLGEVCSNDDCGYVDGIDFGPPERNVINEVEWRVLDDDAERLLAKNPDNRILVETDVTFRVDSARGIQRGRLTGAGENVKRFAFFN